MPVHPSEPSGYIGLPIKRYLYTYEVTRYVPPQFGCATPVIKFPAAQGCCPCEVSLKNSSTQSQEAYPDFRTSQQIKIQARDLLEI